LVQSLQRCIFNLDKRWISLEYQKGKGFQGVMKRWGFSGGAASHGNSLAHRTPGSTGQRQDPGRVFPGKKMAGRMGGEKIKTSALFIFAIYPQKNIISVVGSVPGAPGGMLKIKDTPWFKFLTPPPFPTWLKSIPEKDIIKGKNDKNPWWYEKRADSPKVIQQILAAQQKRLEQKPIDDVFWAKILKDENNESMFKPVYEMDETLVKEGTDLLDRKRRETLKSRRSAGLEAEKTAEESKQLGVGKKPEIAAKGVKKPELAKGAKTTPTVAAKDAKKPTGPTKKVDSKQGKKK